MKRKLFIVLTIWLLVSLACNFGTAKPTETPQPKPTQAPTKTLPPTPTEEAQPKETPTEEAPAAQDGVITTLEDAEKSVVRIEVAGGFELPEFGDFQQNWGGSGFIVDPSGLVVTNNHVVTGAATLKVYFYGDSKPHNARILGASECSDLAVIKLDGEDYPYFEWYEDEIKLGMEVYSLGYPLGDPEISRHKGTVSKRSAEINTNWTSVNSVLEHDAIINPGNSGGPLITTDAKVVGVNYAGANSLDQYYAITYKEANAILDDLKEGKNVMWLGINGEAFISKDQTITGIFVYSVASGSPADKAGIKSGDVIMKMEGIQLAPKGTMKEYCDILRSKGDSATLAIRVFRYGNAQFLEGQINGRPLSVVGGGGDGGSSETNNTDNTQGSGGDGQSKEGDQYYTEEFNAVPKAWKWYLVTGSNEKLVSVNVDDGRAHFHIEDKSSDSYVYLDYEAYTYQNIVVQAETENFGNTYNGIALTCRRSDKGWYELRISSGGTYDVYRYDPALKPKGENPYVKVFGGASNKIKTGLKKINTLGFVCNGTKFQAWVNNNMIWEGEDRMLRDPGKAGVAVMAYRAVPVDVEFEWVRLDPPQ